MYSWSFQPFSDYLLRFIAHCYLSLSIMSMSIKVNWSIPGEVSFLPDHVFSIRSWLLIPANSQQFSLCSGCVDHSINTFSTRGSSFCSVSSLFTWSWSSWVLMSLMSFSSSSVMSPLFCHHLGTINWVTWLFCKHQTV